MSDNPPYVWLDGALVPWDQATIHVTQLGTASVSAVFEGIRAYWSADHTQLYVFHLDAHLQRFFQSMRLIRLPPVFDPATLKQGALDLLRANAPQEDTYLRPFAFIEAPTFGGVPTGTTRVLLSTSRWDSRLKSDKLNRAGVVSWTRLSDHVMPPRIKASSNYLNSRYAAEEAKRHGYDSAILLNAEGHVAEGPGSCLMLVRGGTLITPGVTSGILESITRKTLLDLAANVLHVPVQERTVDRTELYVADEVFFCGTGAEITPVSSVDGLPVGSGELGPITRRLVDLYHDLVRGIDPRGAEWRTPVFP